MPLRRRMGSACCRAGDVSASPALLCMRRIMTCSAMTAPSTAAARAARAPPDASEHLGEFLDVALIEGERLGHGRFAIARDRDLAHAPGGNLLARLAGRLALDELVGDIGRGVTEVDRIPDREGLHRSVQDV